MIIPLIVGLMALPPGSIPLIDHSIIRRARLLALLIQIESPLNLIRDRRVFNLYVQQLLPK